MPVLNPQSESLFARAAAVSLQQRANAGLTRFWRPAASVVVLGLAMTLGWHVVNGNNGLTNWRQKRAEDRRLRLEIDQLTRENDDLRAHVQRLSSDSDAIAHEVRDKLQYVGPGEVVFKLPPKTENAAQPATK